MAIGKSALHHLALLLMTHMDSRAFLAFNK